MWTRLLRPERTPNPLALQWYKSTPLRSREISTNSAIHRGIRRSGFNSKFARRTSWPIKSKSASNRNNERDEFPEWNDRESRPRRPNHLARQDVEDIRESTQQAQDRVKQRLEKYKRVTRTANVVNQLVEYRRRDRGVKSRFSDDTVDRQTRGRFETSYENSRKTMANREKPYQGDRELDMRSIPQRNELPHWRQHENARSSQQESRGPIRPAVDTRSTVRPPFSKQSQGGRDEDSFPKYAARDRDDWSGGAHLSPWTTRSSRGNAQYNKARPEDEDSFRYQRGTDSSRLEKRVRGEAPAPLSIPYTTPASEFLYGTSVVMAALQANRRKLYKLYMYAGENRAVENSDEEVKSLARKRRVEVVEVGIDWLNLLDKMSSGRPHNGYILETSPLPKHPAAGLLRVEGHDKQLAIVLDHQTREDVAINGRDPFIKYKTSFPRYPFLLMLDEILDPGNFGAILRSAHFLGADGVLYSQRNCAPLSAITLKASAGASESIPLIPVSHPPAFIEQAQGNGWKFYAAAASQHKAVGKQTMVTTSNIGSPIRDSPCIIMLGNEGHGLRLNLLKKADHLLTIEGQRMEQGGVDSLNVSVAAALLCEAMLRRPTISQSNDRARQVAIEEDELGDTDALGSSRRKELF